MENENEKVFYVITNSIGVTMFTATSAAIIKEIGYKLFATIGNLALSGFLGGLIMTAAAQVLIQFVQFLIDRKINHLKNKIKVGLGCEEKAFAVEYANNELIENYRKLCYNITKLIDYSTVFFSILIGTAILGVNLNPIVLIPLAILLAIPTIYSLTNICVSAIKICNTNEVVNNVFIINN